MPTVIVTTQAELAALPASFSEYTVIEIRGGSQLCRLIVDKKWENASAVLRGNASAVLWGNASAELWENASAHVKSSGCSLELFGFAVAWLISKAKKVKLRSKTAHVITPEYKQGLKGWLESEGVDVDAKRVVLFKRVSKDWQTQEGTSNETIWKPGDTLEHPKWNPKDQECGEGKYHACSRPYFCNEFRSKPGDRYVAIQIATTDLFAWPNPGYPHKIAFRAGVVLHECNKMGKKLDAVLNS